MTRLKGSRKVRLNLEMSLATVDRLYRLREQTDAASLAEVIRRSINVYDTITKDGERTFLIRRPDGTTTELIFI